MVAGVGGDEEEEEEDDDSLSRRDDGEEEEEDAARETTSARKVCSICRGTGLKPCGQCDGTGVNQEDKYGGKDGYRKGQPCWLCEGKRKRCVGTA